MKIRKFVFRLFFLLFSGITFYVFPARKDSSTTTTNLLQARRLYRFRIPMPRMLLLTIKLRKMLTAKLDELQNNNYAVAGMKSYLSNLNDTVVITGYHPDTTNFPKLLHLPTTTIR